MFLRLFSFVAPNSGSFTHTLRQPEPRQHPKNLPSRLSLFLSLFYSRIRTNTLQFSSRAFNEHLSINILRIDLPQRIEQWRGCLLYRYARTIDVNFSSMYQEGSPISGSGRVSTSGSIFIFLERDEMRGTIIRMIISRNKASREFLRIFLSDFLFYD